MELPPLLSHTLNKKLLECKFYHNNRNKYFADTHQATLKITANRLNTPYRDLHIKIFFLKAHKKISMYFIIVYGVGKFTLFHVNFASCHKLQAVANET